MALKLKVDEGGEYLLPFAKKKLLDLQQQMVRLGQVLGTRYFKVDADSTILMQSQFMLGGANSLDSIRITAAKEGEYWYRARIDRRQCPCRSVSIVVTYPAGYPPLPPSSTETGPYPTLTTVYLSDGTVLNSASGSINRVNDNIGGFVEYASTYVPSGLGANLFWAGEGYVNLVTHSTGPGISEVVTRLPITLPADICGEVSDPFNLFSARERARNKACSDGAKVLLRNGVIPPTFTYANAQFHPYSARAVSGLVPDYFTLVQNVVPTDTSFGSVTQRRYNATRVVTLAYTPADGTAQRVLTFTGSAQLVTTAVGPYSIENYTFSNWPVPRLAPVPGNPNYLGYDSVDQNFGLQTPSSWDADGVIGPSGFPQGSFGAFSGPVNHGALAVFKELNGRWDTIAGGGYVAIGGLSILVYGLDGMVHSNIEGVAPFSLIPPVDTLVYSLPVALQEYYLLSKPRVDTAAINYPDWTSTVPADGEVITIIPMSFVHDDYGDLGMFPMQRDMDDLTKVRLKVDCAVDFRYSYADATYTLVKERSIHDLAVEGSPIAESYTFAVPPDSINNVETGLLNCLFVSRAAPFPDLKTLYGAQRGRISVPVANRPGMVPPMTPNEKLMAVVREAIGSEPKQPPGDT